MMLKPIIDTLEYQSWARGVLVTSASIYRFIGGRQVLLIIRGEGLVSQVVLAVDVVSGSVRLITWRLGGLARVVLEKRVGRATARRAARMIRQAMDVADVARVLAMVL
mgnify:CR=1 FL=1